MTYKGFIKKSRTYDLAAIIAILAAVQPFVPQFELSQNTITIIGMVIAGLIAYLRKITTGPVGEK
jgi:hypothetical protein